MQLAAQKENIESNKQQINQNIKDIEENTNRFTALSEYEVKGQATVNFEVGSSKISAKDQIELKELANTATRLKGYIIEVTGYADSTGSCGSSKLRGFFVESGSAPFLDRCSTGVTQCEMSFANKSEQGHNLSR